MDGNEIKAIMFMQYYILSVKGRYLVLDQCVYIYIRNFRKSNDSKISSLFVIGGNEDLYVTYID